jgi:hypothetical protein
MTQRSPQPVVRPPRLPQAMSVLAAHEDGSVQYNTHQLYGLSAVAAIAPAVRRLTRARSFVLSRSSFLGTGAYAAHWTGDNSGGCVLRSRGVEGRVPGGGLSIGFVAWLWLVPSGTRCTVVASMPCPPTHALPASCPRAALPPLSSHPHPHLACSHLGAAGLEHPGRAEHRAVGHTHGRSRREACAAALQPISAWSRCCRRSGQA